MCFTDGEYPTVFEENWRTARKEHRCVECHMPIRPGERYLDSSGIWPGLGAKTYRTCEVCEWFRDRVTEVERRHGCGSESTPAFGGLNEALDEGEYGLKDLNRLAEE